MPDAETALLLARLQFAFTISILFIFPAFSLGLARYLMVLEALWLKTGRGVSANLFRYWFKISSIVFGMGVVSGFVMAYQFGVRKSTRLTASLSCANLIPSSASKKKP